MIEVVFSSHNGERTLPRMLEALCKLQVPNGGWRLLAVDNASNDATYRIMKAYQERLPIKVITHPLKGKNSALNAALEHIEGDLIVFTDDDVLPASDWLVTLKAAADDNPEYDIFGGVIEPDWPVPPSQWILDYVHMGINYTITDPTLRKGESSPTFIWGPNMMIRARILLEGHRFSDSIGPRAGEAYIMGSETEFTTRLANMGRRCWFEPAARVKHIIRPEQMQRKWLFNRAFRYGKTMALNNYNKSSKERKHMIFGAPRWIYSTIAVSVLRAFLRGATFRSNASFRDMWNLYYHLGGFVQIRKLTLGKE